MSKIFGKLNEIILNLEKLNDRLNTVDIYKSLDLLKLFIQDTTVIKVNKYTPDYKRIVNIFDTNNISYKSFKPPVSPPTRFDIHFGLQTDFRNLYILVALLNNFGLQSVFVSEEDDNDSITVGSYITKYGSCKDISDGIVASEFVKIPFSIDTSTLLLEYYGIDLIYEEEEEEEDGDEREYNEKEDAYESGPHVYGYDDWDEMAYYEAFEGDSDAWAHYN